MSDNNPQPPATNIQMTPVEFSPPASPDAVGSIIGAQRPPFQYSYFLPLAIILLTLIFSTVRDIVTLNKRMEMMDRENAPTLEILKKSGKQTEFLDSMEAGLKKLAPTDTIASQIVTDFFPTPPTPKPDSDNSSPK